MPDISEDRFIEADWHDFYRDAKAEIPPNLPVPNGKPVTISCFVDDSHACDVVTCCSQTGILTFLNQALIHWYSKRQSTVEGSTFCSEYIAMKTAVEMIKAFRYKLRTFGIEIDGPADVFCDMKSVIKNTRNPESTLSKKHNAIGYHLCHEPVAAGIIRVTASNLAYILTKQMSKERREGLMFKFMY